MVAAHYRSHVEFSFEALEEAAVGFRRIEGFLARAARAARARSARTGCTARSSSTAMDDDLGTPPRSPRSTTWSARATSCSPTGDSAALRGNAASVRAMLAVLGLDPLDPHWARRRSGSRREADRRRVDALVAGLLEQRARARADKDFAAADAIRDQLKAAGIELEDTPQGPQWSI